MLLTDWSYPRCIEAEYAGTVQHSLPSSYCAGESILHTICLVQKGRQTREKEVPARTRWVADILWSISLTKEGIMARCFWFTNGFSSSHSYLSFLQGFIISYRWVLEIVHKIVDLDMTAYEMEKKVVQLNCLRNDNLCPAWSTTRRL